MPGIEREVIIFAAAVLTGAAVRLAYGCLGCFRQIVKHSPAAVEAEDLLYWIAAAVYIFMQIYHTSSGSIRWYFILGLVLGAVFMEFLVRKTEKMFEKNLHS